MWVKKSVKVVQEAECSGYDTEQTRKLEEQRSEPSL
jgi:hypothetical protein